MVGCRPCLPVIVLSLPACHRSAPSYGIRRPGGSPQPPPSCCRYDLEDSWTPLYGGPNYSLVYGGPNLSALASHNHLLDSVNAAGFQHRNCPLDLHGPKGIPRRGRRRFAYGRVLRATRLSSDYSHDHYLSPGIS